MMRTTFAAALTAIFAFILATGAAGAHTLDTGWLQVIHPWVEASKGGDSLAHPTIVNDGEEEIVLLGADTPMAERVDILVDDRIVRQLTIPAEDSVVFDGEPFSLAMIGLKGPLIEGDNFPFRLHFCGHTTIDAHMVVGEATMMPKMTEEMSAKEPTSHRITIDYDPIPAVGLPAKTSDFPLCCGARTDYLTLGEAVYFSLVVNDDGELAVSSVRPAQFGKPTPQKDVTPGAGILEAIATE